jgi:integrase
VTHCNVTHCNTCSASLSIELRPQPSGGSLPERTSIRRAAHGVHLFRIRDIGKLDVQQFVADKFRQQAGWQTVRNSWTLLSGILETAVEYGYLTVNPARGVKFPPQKLRDAPAMIAGGAFTKLLNEVEEPYRMMIGLIAATGLRIGELLALRWRNLDLTIGTSVDTQIRPLMDT